MAYAACTRLILRAAKGHDYISQITDEISKREIVSLASVVHTLMFGNKYVDYTDLDNLPIAGMLSSSHNLDIIAQTVIICNKGNKELLQAKIETKTLKKY